MSTVSSKSGASGQDEVTRQAREDYRKKEAELIKKHNNEIRALNDRYSEALDNKDKMQAKNLNEARTKSQESLNQRDVKFQKEMDELRKMHSKQLEKLIQDNNLKVKTQASTSRQEVKQSNLGKEDRVKNLNSQYDIELRAEQDKFAKALEDLREDQKQSIGQTRDQLNEAHEKELEATRDERNQTVSELKNEYRTLRQNTDQRLRNQEVHHMQDKMRENSAHMDNIRREVESHNKIQDISREGFQQSVKDVRDKMAKAREQDLENGAMTNENFKANVDS
jgi:hypothetical protein